jgi:hypothetical protein
VKKLSGWRPTRWHAWAGLLSEGAAFSPRSALKKT